MLKPSKWACWHAAVFRLPLAQCKALEWWGAPPTFSGLHPMDFLSPTDASNLRYFCAMRKENTLALAQALQACANELGVPAGILCELAWELQGCMAPLMTLSGDNFVESSLLKSMGDKHGTPPHWRKKLLLYVRKLNCPQFQVPPRNLLSKVLLLVPLPPLFPNQTATLFWRGRSLGGELMLTQIILVGGFAITSRRMIECWNGGENSNHSSPPWMKALAMSFPWKIWKELRIVEWWGLKRQWYWPRLYEDVLSILGCPQGCSAEHCRNFTSASPPWFRVATWLTLKC